MSFLARTIILIASGVVMYIGTGIAFALVDPIFFALQGSGQADPLGSPSGALFWLRLSLTLMVVVIIGWFIFAPLREDRYVGGV